MRFHSVLFWLACLTRTATSAVLVRGNDNTLLLQRGVEKAKNIIPDAESFLKSPDDRKKASVVLHDVGGARTFAKFQGLSIKTGQFGTSDCDKLSSLWTSLSNHVIEASPLLSTVVSNPNLASWAGGMDTSLKRDMGHNILHLHDVFDTKANPAFDPLLRELQTKCSDSTEDINIAAENAVLALDEVLKHF